MFEVFLAILGGIGAVCVPLIDRTIIDHLPGFRRQADESQETLETRLNRLSESMQSSAQLMEQVSAELDLRAALAKKLKEEAKTAEALAALHKEQADAIRRMIDGELAQTEHRIRRDSVIVGIVSFIGGGLVTLAVTLLVHPLH